MQRAASLVLIEEYIGAAATVRLIEAFAGRCLKVPKRPAGRIWAQLVTALGEHSASEFVQFFGGETAYIARNHAEEVAARRRAVRQMRAAGLSWAEIARTLPRPSGPWTERGVRKMAEAERQDERQGELFEV